MEKTKLVDDLVHQDSDPVVGEDSSCPQKYLILLIQILRMFYQLVTRQHACIPSIKYTSCYLLILLLVKLGRPTNPTPRKKINKKSRVNRVRNELQTG